MATAFIGLGANLGDRAATLREAAQRLAALGRITAVSSLYETEPVAYREQPPFLNAAVALETKLPPAELMQALLGIERDMGRVRTIRNAPRILDLDLLMVDDLILDTPELALPHPRMPEREFVLVPLTEIAPDAVHPAMRRSVSELLAVLPQPSGVAVFSPPGWASSRDP